MRSRALPLAAALLVATACSSAGSTADGSSPGPSGPPSTAAPAVVDSALRAVLGGLRTATSVGATSDLATDGRTLQSAASQLSRAATAVGALAGLPRSVITPVATGLTRVAGQLGQAGRCLSAQAAAAKPDPTTCVPLLRQAEAQDAAIAHGLISLSAYGTESPKAFEADLVAALHGN